jgi:PAS domain S-box-containing protein
VLGTVARLTGAPWYTDRCRARLTGAGQPNNQFASSPNAVVRQQQERWELSEPKSVPRLGSDQNLLFGALALQAGLLDPMQFADACSAWATRLDCALADLLVQRHWLTAEDRAEVERLLERKLRKQGSRLSADQASSTPSPAATPSPTMTQAFIALPPAQRYARKELHATGGMGQVWRARDPDLDREVAMKVLLPDRVNDHQLRERFLLEARVMGQLSHPGIPPVHVLSQDEQGAPYYVMKFIDGRTLEEAIAAYHRQPTPSAFRDLLRHFGGVCQTIAFAHSRGILHRDLKPRNIMIGDFGETFVLDWGLAKQVKPAGDTPSPREMGDSDQGLTQVGQILGTPAYIPPEQLTGSPAGPLTDLYALGVILYEILAGQMPYQGNTTLEILVQASKGQITPPSQLRGEVVSRKLEEICLKATALRPVDRFQSAAELTRAVEDWLSDELVRSEAALRESEAQLRTLLESTAEAIYGADLAGNCIFCNPACVHMLGYREPSDLLGSHMHSLMHHHRADGSVYPLEECHIYQAFKEGRGTHVTDEVYWRADGTPFPVEYWSYPVRREGQVVGCVVSFLDITERMNRERELLLARETADQGCRAASTELEDLRRQLQGSLDALVAMTARLQQTELSSEQRGHLDRMRTTTEQLLALAAPRSVPAEGTH